MTTPLSLEQRILIAAEYNADRVEDIKELMEDYLSEAVKLLKRAYELNNHDMGFDVDVTEFLEKINIQSNKQVKP